MEKVKITLPDTLPLFPLSQAIIFPRSTTPLNIFEPRYLQLIQDVFTEDGLFGMIQPLTQENINNGEGAQPELFRVGCAVRIMEGSGTKDRKVIKVAGIARFVLTEELAVTTPYRQAKVDWAPFTKDYTTPTDGVIDRDALLKALKYFLEAQQINVDWEAIAGSPDEVMVNTLSMILRLPVLEKQSLLEAPTLQMRAHKLVTILEMLAHSGQTPSPTAPLN